MIYYVSLLSYNNHRCRTKYLTFLLKIFFLSFVLLSCRAVDEDLVISVNEDVISEYAISPSDSNLAVVVPAGKYFA